MRLADTRTGMFCLRSERSQIMAETSQIRNDTQRSKKRRTQVLNHTWCGQSVYPRQNRERRVLVCRLSFSFSVLHFVHGGGKERLRGRTSLSRGMDGLKPEKKRKVHIEKKRKRGRYKLQKDRVASLMRPTWSRARPALRVSDFCGPPCTPSLPICFCYRAPAQGLEIRLQRTTKKMLSGRWPS